MCQGFSKGENYTGTSLVFLSSKKLLVHNATYPWDTGDNYVQRSTANSLVHRILWIFDACANSGYQALFFSPPPHTMPPRREPGDEAMVDYDQNAYRNLEPLKQNKNTHTHTRTCISIIQPHLTAMYTK